MKNIFNKRIAAPLAVLVLSSLALVPNADAREARAGGGGTRANAGNADRQVDNTRQDARSNDVRNASVNNVNSTSNNRNVNGNNVNGNRNVNGSNIDGNRNVNVNVNGNGGNNCCNNGWDNDHPVAAAAAVAAVVVGIGTRVAAPPANANCVPVNSGGIVYQQCGSTWYQPQGGQYVVVAPPY